MPRVGRARGAGAAPWIDQRETALTIDWIADGAILVTAAAPYGELSSISGTSRCFRRDITAASMSIRASDLGLGS